MKRIYLNAATIWLHFSDMALHVRAYCLLPIAHSNAERAGYIHKCKQMPFDARMWNKKLLHRQRDATMKNMR